MDIFKGVRRLSYRSQLKEMAEIHGRIPANLNDIKTGNCDVRHLIVAGVAVSGETFVRDIFKKMEIDVTGDTIDEVVDFLMNVSKTGSDLNGSYTGKETSNTPIEFEPFSIIEFCKTYKVSQSDARNALTEMTKIFKHTI